MTRLPTDQATKLAERCERAAGPDRELDGAIRKAVVGDFGFCGDGDGAWWCSACSVPSHELTQTPGCGAPMGLHDERRSYPSDWREDERLPAYTASLDAAMSLVPEGMVAAITNCGCVAAQPDFSAATAIVGKPDDPNKAVVAATPALALTAACLRALAQVQS